jgi:uncharacterized protein (DUF2237 family)
MRALLTLTAFVAATSLGAVAIAAPKPDSKMQVCAAQWQQMKAANKTGGTDYKTFSSSCLKGASAPAPQASAIKPTPAAMVSKPTSAKPMPAVMMSKPAAAGAKPQDRMKACGAQWQQMKAANKTGGMTYQQFSSKCLKN